jgi:hypothetical protein
MEFNPTDEQKLKWKRERELEECLRSLYWSSIENRVSALNKIPEILNIGKILLF